MLGKTKQTPPVIYMQLAFTQSLQLLRPRLDFSEWIMVRIALGVVLLDGVMIVLGGADVAYSQYAVFAGLAVLIFAIGQIYRHLERSEALASSLICTALMIVFSQAFVVYNFLLLPLYKPVVDPFLMQVDSIFGYHWPDIVAFAAANPWTNFVIKSAYMSTVPQITVLVLILGLTGRKIWLHTLMLAIFVTSVMVVIIWAIWPTAGPMSILQLPADVVELAQPLLGSDYGTELRRLIETGPIGTINPTRIQGLISFPSYHTTLAFICAFCSYGFRPVFPFFVVLNALVLPGTLMHGGHHLVDVLAGVVVFVVGILIAKKMIGYAGKDAYSNSQTAS